MTSSVSPAAPLLEVRDVDVAYGDVQVLWGLSFSVGPGEIVALIGANGAGKSTTLKTISGILSPRRGQILYRGEQSLAIADRAYVLETGKVGMQGAGRDLLNDPHVKAAYLGL